MPVISAHAGLLPGGVCGSVVGSGKPGYQLPLRLALVVQNKLCDSSQRCVGEFRGYYRPLYGPLFGTSNQPSG